jgi:hypothetical protein
VLHVNVALSNCALKDRIGVASESSRHCHVSNITRNRKKAYKILTSQMMVWLLRCGAMSRQLSCSPHCRPPFQSLSKP